MITQSVNNQEFKTSKPSFCAMRCTDKKTVNLMTSVRKKYLNSLEKITYEQEENPVDIYFSSKFGRRLSAAISSIYQIKDFKAHYVQKAIIESRFSFIKRVVRHANEYKAQITAEAKLNPEAFLQQRNARQKELISRLIKQEKDSDLQGTIKKITKNGV